MSVNKTKKIILKTHKKTENKYTGIGDQIEENVISGSIKGTNNNKNQNSNINQNKESSNLSNVKDDQKDINKLSEELDFLKSEYESQKAEITDEIKVINNEILEKNYQLKILSKDNYKLIDKLKDIGKNLKGELLKSYKEILNKRKLAGKSEKILKYNLAIKEEEIKNAKKIAEGEKREKERYETLLNEVNNGMEQNIIDELKQLNDNIYLLNDEILGLSEIRLIHKNCEKNIQNLKNKLNLYKTEIEFESKRNNMLLNKTNKSNPSPNKNQDISNEPNKNLFSENNESLRKKLKYSKKIRTIILKKNSTKPEKLNISAYRYVSDNINLINKSQSRKMILNDITNNNTKLFTEVEYDLLNEIIPSRYMNRYLDEFESRKKAKEEIENLFEEHNNIKDIKQQIQFKIDYVEVKIKEEEKKYIELLLKFRNNNKKKNELKNMIKNCEREIKSYNKKIKREEKMQKMYEGIQKQNEDINSYN